MAVMMYHMPGGLNNRQLSLEFWRLEVQGQHADNTCLSKLERMFPKRDRP
ncbi:hypothetical protein LEMLEM_LOCUS8328 [Lemmus lemmus]